MENKEEKRIYTYEELEEFCKKNNRLPKSDRGEYGLYNFLTKHKEEFKFKELYEKYSKKIIHTFEELEKFCIEHNRLPQQKLNKEESNLCQFLNKHKEEPRFKKLYKKYGKRVYHTYEELKEFCIKHNRFPKGNEPLYNFYERNKEELKFKELYEKYSKRIIHTFEELEEFCIKHDRFPKQGESSGVLYKFYIKHKEEPRFKELYEKYGKIRNKHTFEELEEFCIKHNRLPIRNDSSKLYQFLLRNKNNPKFKDLIKRYKKHIPTFEELEEFCKKHNRLPSKYLNNKEEGSLNYFLIKHKEEPRFKELYEKYGKILYCRKHTFEELEKFGIKHNRLPNQQSKEE
jgi:hypothetical protein